MNGKIFNDLNGETGKENAYKFISFYDPYFWKLAMEYIEEQRIKKYKGHEILKKEVAQEFEPNEEIKLENLTVYYTIFVNGLGEVTFAKDHNENTHDFEFTNKNGLTWKYDSLDYLITKVNEYNKGDI